MKKKLLRSARKKVGHEVEHIRKRGLHEQWHLYTRQYRAKGILVALYREVALFPQAAVLRVALVPTDSTALYIGWPPYSSRLI